MKVVQLVEPLGNEHKVRETIHSLWSAPSAHQLARCPKSQLVPLAGEDGEVGRLFGSEERLVEEFVRQYLFVELEIVATYLLRPYERVPLQHVDERSGGTSWNWNFHRLTLPQFLFGQRYLLRVLLENERKSLEDAFLWKRDVWVCFIGKNLPEIHEIFGQVFRLEVISVLKPHGNHFKNSSPHLLLPHCFRVFRVCNQKLVKEAQKSYQQVLGSYKVVVCQKKHFRERRIFFFQKQKMMKKMKKEMNSKTNLRITVDNQKRNSLFQSSGSNNRKATKKVTSSWSTFPKWGFWKR